jgi:hypothetical protein
MKAVGPVYFVYLVYLVCLADRTTSTRRNGVRSCNHTFHFSAYFNRRLTVAGWTPMWSAISANGYPYCR